LQGIDFFHPVRNAEQKHSGKALCMFPKCQRYGVAQVEVAQVTADTFSQQSSIKKEEFSPIISRCKLVCGSLPHTPSFKIFSCVEAFFLTGHWSVYDEIVHTWRIGKRERFSPPHNIHFADVPYRSL
jgi:hypothetical protein